MLYMSFFPIGIHTMQGWTATTRHGVTRKISTKRLSIQEISLDRNFSLWKAFYRQRIPGSSCARTETVDIDILVSSRDGERKIIHSE